MDIGNPRENIIISAGGASETVQENGVPAVKGLHASELEAAASSAQNEKRIKKRGAVDPDLDYKRCCRHWSW